MKTEIEFEYQVIRYAHDPSSGEALNIGIVVYARQAPFLQCKLDARYKRLSDAFAGFDGEQYRSVIRRFLSSVDKIQNDFSVERLDLWPAPASLASVTDAIWPDCGLSYQLGQTRSGVTSDLAAVLENLYARFVTDQSTQEPIERRTDEDVWSIYQRHLAARNIGRLLQPATVRTDAVEIKFEHAYRNGRLYALQPMSMDMACSENIQNKATNWLGKAVAISGNEELAKIYLLLGKPSDPSLMGAYEKAKHLLSMRLGVQHDLVEESSADCFADALRRKMLEQGVLQET